MEISAEVIELFLALNHEIKNVVSNLIYNEEFLFSSYLCLLHFFLNT